MNNVERFLSMRSQGISQFYLHTPRSSANGMNHICLYLLSLSWSSFTDPGVGLGGWLHAEISVGIDPGHGHPFQY